MPQNGGDLRVGVEVGEKSGRRRLSAPSTCSSDLACGPSCRANSLASGDHRGPGRLPTLRCHAHRTRMPPPETRIAAFRKRHLIAFAREDRAVDVPGMLCLASGDGWTALSVDRRRRPCGSGPWSSAAPWTPAVVAVHHETPGLNHIPNHRSQCCQAAPHLCAPQPRPVRTSSPAAPSSSHSVMTSTPPAPPMRRRRCRSTLPCPRLWSVAPRSISTPESRFHKTTTAPPGTRHRP
jgi:hypothetical protein